MTTSLSLLLSQKPGENVPTFSASTCKTDGTLPMIGYRQDGVLSVMTGIGTARDKGTSIQNVPDPRMDQQELDDLYEDNELLHIIIDTIVDDALRNWIDINHVKAAEIQKELKRLLAKDRFAEAGKMDRLHGGCAIFMDIDDGGQPFEPLNWDKIKSFNGMEVLERWYIWPRELMRSLRSELYVMFGQTLQETLVHRSRLLIFPGESVARNTRLKNMGWGGQVVKRLKRALLGYTMGQGCLPTIVQEFTVDVFKMAGLNEMSYHTGEQQSEDEAAFKAKMDFMQQAKSMVQMVICDKEDEIVKQTTNVSGLTDILRTMGERLAAAAQMPFSKLFGFSISAAMSSNADADKENWKSKVECYQSDKLCSHLETVIQVIGKTLGIEGDIPFTFNPLYKPTQMEQATLQNTQAKTDLMLKALGIPVPVIVAARYGGPEFSISTQVAPEVIDKLETTPSTIPTKKGDALDVSPEVLAALEKGLGLGPDKKIGSVRLAE